jgi:hypothetical protein
MVRAHQRKTRATCAGLFVCPRYARALPCGRLVCHALRFAVVCALPASLRSMRAPALSPAHLRAHAVGLWTIAAPVRAWPAAGGGRPPARYLT